MVSAPPPPLMFPDRPPLAYLKLSAALPPARLSTLTKEMPLLRKPELAPLIFHWLATSGPRKVSTPGPPSTTRPFLGTGLPLLSFSLNESAALPRSAVTLLTALRAKTPTELVPERTWTWLASLRRRVTASEPPVPRIFRTPPD